MTIKEASEATVNWPINSGWFTVIHYFPDDGTYIASDRQEGDESIFKRKVIRVIETNKHVSVDTIAKYTKQALECQKPRYRD